MIDDDDGEPGMTWRDLYGEEIGTFAVAVALAAAIFAAVVLIP